LDGQAKIGNMTDTTARLADWTVLETPVTDATAADLLRRYIFDVASSYYGRPATDDEMTVALADNPNDDLVAPGGLFMVAWHGGVPVGCVGLRLGPPPFAELTRVFITPEARGQGGGPVLLTAAEDAARRHGVRTIRLDTRLDLLAARRLYTANGYREIPAFAVGPYKEVWYAKEIV
jgi:ribosomal protein S18 acetylase RimI-like enzyme